INARPITREKDHPEKRDRERDPDDRLIHVRHWGPARDQAAHRDSARVKEQTGDRDDDADELKVAAFSGRFAQRSGYRTRAWRAAEMYDREQEERKPITQSGAVKSVPVVVEIFEAQLRFRRINLRTQLAQFIAQRVRGPAEFESVALMI